MRFARRLVLLPLLSLLAACSPTTPLFVAQVTTGEVAEYKQMKSNRMTAAIEEEGDLLTYSAMAIRDNRSAEAEKLYLTGYDNRRYSAEVRGISLYQIGLIYMSRYNDQRDDAKATDYFQRVVREFPGTHAAEHAQARLLAMRQRAREPVQKSARELLATWKPQQNLDLYKTSLDPDADPAVAPRGAQGSGRRSRRALPAGGQRSGDSCRYKGKSPLPARPDVPGAGQPAPEPRQGNRIPASPVARLS